MATILAGSTEGLIRVEILRYRKGLDSGFLPIHAESPRGAPRFAAPRRSHYDLG